MTSQSHVLNMRISLNLGYAMSLFGFFWGQICWKKYSVVYVFVYAAVFFFLVKGTIIVLAMRSLTIIGGKTQKNDSWCIFNSNA